MFLAFCIRGKLVCSFHAAQCEITDLAHVVREGQSFTFFNLIADRSHFGALASEILLKVEILNERLHSPIRVYFVEFPDIRWHRRPFPFEITRLKQDLVDIRVLDFDK